MSSEWRARAAFVSWAPADRLRQEEHAARADVEPAFLDELGQEVIAVVLDVLGRVDDPTVPMAEVERVAQLPRERARLVFEQAGYYVTRWLLDDVPAAQVASVTDGLGWMALIARGEGVIRRA